MELQTFDFTYLLASSADKLAYNTECKPGEKLILLVGHTPESVLKNSEHHLPKNRTIELSQLMLHYTSAAGL